MCLSCLFNIKFVSLMKCLHSISVVHTTVRVPFRSLLNSLALLRRTLRFETQLHKERNWEIFHAYKTLFFGMFSSLKFSLSRITELEPENREAGSSSQFNFKSATERHARERTECEPRHRMCAFSRAQRNSFFIRRNTAQFFSRILLSRTAALHISARKKKCLLKNVIKQAPACIFIFSCVRLNRIPKAFA